jgi:NADH dehydrogenase
VTAVISTASSTLSRQDDDSIETVDRQGQLDLIEAAESAGVEHFVLVSFPSVAIDFPLQDAKRAVEARLRRSRMTHTILQPTCFTEVWFGPALGFDLVNGKAQIYGDGRKKTSWISFRDVARFAVAALDPARARNATVKLGGPEALSPLEVVRLAERSTGRPLIVQHVAEATLREHYEAATDSLQRSFAALMLYYAQGDVVDMDETRQVFSVGALTSVQDCLSNP